MSDEAPHTKWIPLESNPEVMNEWARIAGLLTEDAQFEDVYGLDNELLSLVVQPVKAIILVFPITPSIEEKRIKEDAKLKREGQHLLDERLVFIPQTIPNACGTIALLHAVANTDVAIEPGSPLFLFLAECKDKTPAERAKLLESTALFANIHAEVAQGGQSHVPIGMETELHFTAFVSAPSPETGAMRLVELDGRRDFPIDHGPCSDILNDVARVVRETYISLSASMHFGMISLGPAAL